MHTTRMAWGAVALVLVVAAALLDRTRFAERLDGAIADELFHLERARRPAAADEGAVVLVGVDEASTQAIAPPLSLWHHELGAVMQALAAARPRAVALDLVLPQRSYEPLMPGADAALATGLHAASRVAPVVLGISAGDGGRPLAPLPLFIAAAGGHVGFAGVQLDGDGVARRYTEALGPAGQRVPTLAGEVMRALGRAPAEGLVDYGHGPRFDYVSLRAVLEQARNIPQLERWFGGRIVLVGSVLPLDDRLPQPLNLARWEGADVVPPGMLFHAQALRSMASGRILGPAAWPVLLVIWVAAALLVLPARAGLAVAAWLGLLAALAVACWVAYQAGRELPVASAALVGTAALLLRQGTEAARGQRERRRLKASLAGYVSPQVLQAVSEDPAAIRSRHRALAFLFADLRGFTPLTESRDPESVVALLNRYFAVAVDAIHAQGGTIDNFRGDGVMAFFGAPLAQARPAAAAFSAAVRLIEGVAALSRSVEAEGGPPLAVSIGLATGEAVVGNVGAPDRFHYTAIGDAVNVAARLQSLATELGYPVLMSAACAQGLEEAALVPLGEQPLKGHRPVQVVGWRPLPEAADAEKSAANPELAAYTPGRLV